jgi:hypothetical protein
MAGRQDGEPLDGGGCGGELAVVFEDHVGAVTGFQADLMDVLGDGDTVGLASWARTKQASRPAAAKLPNCWRMNLGTAFNWPGTSHSLASGFLRREGLACQ